MSQQQPPPQSGPPLPYHTEAEIQQSKDIAKRFYAADSQLQVSDREQLAGMFSSRMTIFPLLGLPVIYAFVQAPNWLKKGGLMSPKKQTRGLQVALGLFGVFAGMGFSQKVARVYQTSKLSDKPASQEAYRILSRYPPQLGSRYYALTSRSPQFALKDPDTIDWTRELGFPLMLVLKQPRPGEMPTPWSPGPIQQAPGTAPDQNQSQNQSQSQNQPFSVNSSTQQIPPAVGSPMNTWDKVRRGTYGQPAPGSGISTSSDAPISQAWGSDDRAYQSSDSDSDVEQRQFDAMLEREHNGEDALQDDFTNSEKKW